MTGIHDTIELKPGLRKNFFMLESEDISTEIGSDICQVMICFVAKYVEVPGCTLGGRRFIYPAAQSLRRNASR